MTHSEAGKLGGQNQAKREEQCRQRIAVYEQNPKRCKFCQVAIPFIKRRNNYCGRSCSASMNNSGVRRHGVSRACGACGGKLQGCAKKYCSSDCFQLSQWNVIKQKIETNGAAQFRHTAKRYITERDGNQCRVCGLSEWLGKSLGLILDHIDGNSENWSIVNLRLLCPNCDSQTPTYKGRNLGKGRHSRRQRYSEGKSY